MSTDKELKTLGIWDKLFWDMLPGRCALCGRWKLWGKQPHKACQDAEQARADAAPPPGVPVAIVGSPPDKVAVVSAGQHGLLVMDINMAKKALNEQPPPPMLPEHFHAAPTKQVKVMSASGGVKIVAANRYMRRHQLKRLP